MQDFKTISNWVWKYSIIPQWDQKVLAKTPSYITRYFCNQLPQILNSYIENNITTLGIVPTIGNFQEEFYDGEYSGSALETLITQSNPYKSVPPSSNIHFSSTECRWTHNATNNNS